MELLYKEYSHFLTSCVMVCEDHYCDGCQRSCYFHFAHATVLFWSLARYYWLTLLYFRQCHSSLSCFSEAVSFSSGLSGMSLKEEQLSAIKAV